MACSLCWEGRICCKVSAAKYWISAFICASSLCSAIFCIVSRTSSPVLNHLLDTSFFMWDWLKIALKNVPSNGYLGHIQILFMIEFSTPISQYCAKYHNYSWVDITQLNNMDRPSVLAGSLWKQYTFFTVLFELISSPVAFYIPGSSSATLLFIS